MGGLTGQVMGCEPAVLLPQHELAWYAVHTYSRHEKKVAAEFEGKGLETFLPLLKQVHRWSDRNKTVELPLFPCYAFVRVAESAQEKVRVLSTGGVIGLVGAGRVGTPIPASEVEGIRAILENNVRFDPYPFLKVGQRVRVRGGSLDGLEGILLERVGGRKLVVSITGVERSLSICIEGLQVEAA